ncbi:AAA family ATPase [Lentzea sp. NPDC102401]|uniref:AAA family ATPase n=1 Tax=Lentzea sp. NPDC102401 TaxID=3364128 RepID=UPI00382CEE82
MAQPPSRFVAVGVGAYTLMDVLEYPVPGITAICEYLKTAGFDGEPLTDPDEATVRDHLSQIRSAMQDDGGVLIVMWTGHGVPAAGDLLLLTTEHRGDGSNGLSANEVARKCAFSGANQMLLILDACHSGLAVHNAAAVVSAVFNEVQPRGDRMWAGVLVSCSAAGEATAGVFGGRLHSLLSNGPDADNPELHRTWNERNRMIPGDELGYALLADWNNEDQVPQFVQVGRPGELVINPRHDRNAPSQVVEHLLNAAYGTLLKTDRRAWFTGRTTEVNRVVDWVTAATPGVYVVTGSAGTGKSAILGRVACMSDPKERGKLVEFSPPREHRDPGENSVHANVHARGLNADRIADLLSTQLVAGEHIDPPQGERRSAAELIGVVQQLARPLVLMVDGLDEARGEAFTIAVALLTPLAGCCTVIVSTRELKPVNGGKPLVTTLAPLHTLDLDEPEFQESGKQALREYIAARLLEDGASR